MKRSEDEEGDKNEDKKRKKSPATRSSLIDHTYYDFSTRELSELLPESKNNSDDSKEKGRVTFPMKLHEIISKPEHRHIICWMPHGRSWKILDKGLLESVICKEYFNHESASSFNRSVNGWGFKVRMDMMFSRFNICCSHFDTYKTFELTMNLCSAARGRRT